MRTPATALRVCALVCAFALVVAACGDDDDSASVSSDTEAADTGGADLGETADETAADTGETGSAAAGGELEALRVPDDFGTIQEAVDAAEPGDLVLISPGVYHEAVQVQTENIVIRGLDRNEVILDGEFDEDYPHGFQVFSNGVAIENLTTRNFTSNGVFFTGSYDDDFILTGYRASYITAHNNGDYGIYAFNASEGLFEHLYGSGHPDSAVYVGQCRPCNAIVTDVLGENNALGYSGTNASGNLWVINNEWRNNRVGVVPNTLSSEELGPQGDGNFAGNYVHSNGNLDTPRKGGDWDLAFGVGMVVAGGNENSIAKNLVTDNENAGIAVAFFPSGDDIFPVNGNRVFDNVVTGNGVADLVLLSATEGLNCFENNEFETSMPPEIEVQAACDIEPPAAFEGDLYPIEEKDLATIDYQDVPAPTLDFENMPNADSAPPEPAVDMMPSMTLDDVSLPTP